MVAIREARRCGVERAATLHAAAPTDFSEIRSDV
jgi:hypothetical protein